MTVQCLIKLFVIKYYLTLTSVKFFYEQAIKR